MNVFVLGATGFIGTALVRSLQQRGHRVVLGVRPPQKARTLFPDADLVEVDLEKDFDAGTWIPRLHGIDAVINAAGSFAPAASLEAVHFRAPAALFDACARTLVARVIAVSALGADDDAATDFHRTKRAADDHLMSLPLHAAVVLPSLVFGLQGASARTFLLAATFRFVPLPGGGHSCVQPVLLDDLVEGIVRLLDTRDTGRIAAVGPRAVPFRDYLQSLRYQMGLRAAWILPLPWGLSRFAARALAWLRAPLLSPDALSMLARGNVADADRFEQILGRPAVAVTGFIPSDRKREFHDSVSLPLWMAVLRCALAIVWLSTAAVSAGIFPVAESLALLSRMGIPSSLAPLLLYGATGLDAMFGLVLLFAPRGRRLYGLQAAVIVLYSALIAWKLPEFWLHPFAPMWKNVPMLAALWILSRAEKPE